MKSVEISVIIPVYNEEKYIIKAIKSILNQTFENIELIVINDGSEDHTREFVRSIKDNRLRLIEKEEHSGAVHCFQIALESAKGRFIARMDADDMSLPERLEKQHKAFSKDVDLLAAGTGIYFMNYRDGDFRKIIPVCDHETICTGMQTHSQINAASSMYRKDALVKVGGYDKNDPRAWAYSCNIKLSKLGRLGNIAEPEYVYFIRKGKAHQGSYRKFHARNRAMAVMTARAGSQYGGTLKSRLASGVWSVYHYIPRSVQVLIRNSVSKKKNIRLTPEEINEIESQYDKLEA